MLCSKTVINSFHIFMYKYQVDAGGGFEFLLLSCLVQSCCGTGVFQKRHLSETCRSPLELWVRAVGPARQ